MRSLTRVISMESIILSLICLADMFSTLFLVSLGRATEQNPLMAACLRQGAMTFVLVKTASFVPFIITVEWYRRRKPDFARSASRTAIIVYVLAYIILTLKANIA